MGCRRKPHEPRDLFSHAEPKDRALARAYADAALAIAPEWHYVRDILGPQIEALPPGSSEVASEVARNKEVARRFLEQAFGPQWRVARLGLAAARPLARHHAHGFGARTRLNMVLA